MAIEGHEKAQITARAGLLRAGTGRAEAVGDSQSIFLTDDEDPNSLGGEFRYTEDPEGERIPEDPPQTPYTNVAK